MDIADSSGVFAEFGHVEELRRENIRFHRKRSSRDERFVAFPLTMQFSAVQFAFQRSYFRFWLSRGHFSKREFRHEGKSFIPG